MVSLSKKYSFNSFYSYYWHYFGLLNIGIIIGLSWTNFLWVIDNLYIFLRVKNEQKQFLLIWIYFTELTFYWHSFFEKTFSQISNLTICQVQRLRVIEDFGFKRPINSITLDLLMSVNSWIQGFSCFPRDRIFAEFLPAANLIETLLIPRLKTSIF